MRCHVALAKGLFSTLLLLLTLNSVTEANPYEGWKHEKGYENGIPIGTKITAANWQQYQQFMDPGLTMIFSGKSFWKLPPDFEMDVGPTISIPLPKAVREDTEKYSGQVRLVKTAEGGYYPVNYTAGVPFPNPTQGDPTTVAARIFYNAYYAPRVRLDRALEASYTMDQYGNQTQTAVADTVESRFAFNSDPPYPTNLPEDTGGHYWGSYEEIETPEQSKYFTVMINTFRDSTRINEEYEYVPTLRRSLRLSQAARCAPLFGTDLDVEDLNILPLQGNLFQFKYLGEKKLLVVMHENSNGFDSLGTLDFTST